MIAANAFSKGFLVVSTSAGPISHIAAQAHRYLYAAETIVGFDPVAAGRAADIGLNIIGDAYVSSEDVCSGNVCLESPAQASRPEVTDSKLALAHEADRRGNPAQAATLRIWVLAARIQLLG